MAISRYNVGTKSLRDTIQSSADGSAVVSNIDYPSIYDVEYLTSQGVHTGAIFMDKQKNVRSEVRIRAEEKHFATRITYAIHVIREAIKTKDYRSIWVKL
jgi:hypothetical protein